MKFYLNQCDINIRDKSILKKVCIEITKAKLFRFSGGNGSGKTVLFNTLLGLNTFTEGEIIISYDKKDMCYVTDTNFFFDDDMTGEVIKTLSFFYGETENDIYEAAQDLRLDVMAIKKSKISELSKGMKKKLAILPVMFDKPCIYFLDEIFTGLDIDIQAILSKRICELINIRNCTVAIIEHNEQIIQNIINDINEGKVEEYQCINHQLIRKR